MDYVVQLLSLLFETIGAEELSPEVLQQLRSLEYAARVSLFYALPVAAAVCFYDFFDTCTEFVNEYAAPIILGFQAIYTLFVILCIVVFGGAIIGELLHGIFNQAVDEIECGVNALQTSTSFVAELALVTAYSLIALCLLTGIVWIPLALFLPKIKRM